jgi:hypothetical protein
MNLFRNLAHLLGQASFRTQANLDTDNAICHTLTEVKVFTYSSFASCGG